jgi:uncharacterized protein
MKRKAKLPFNPQEFLAKVNGGRSISDYRKDKIVFRQGDVIAAVMDHHNAIIAALDTGFKQIEAKQSVDYRPLFLAPSGKPNHDVVRTWVRGFGKAMALAPARWSSIAEDERLQPLLSPFIGFMDVEDPSFEPADNIDELLDEAATAIPRATIILRKIAQFSTAATAGRRKIGRNDPCPCGSGRKYKRCCGTAHAQN